MVKKILDGIRFTLIAVIIGMLIYKYLNKDQFHLELNNYLQTSIFVLMAIEAYRIFGPKGEEDSE